MSIVAAFLMPHPPVILPEIGKGEERKIQKTIDACNEIGRMVGEMKPDVIVLSSPHATVYNDYFHISPGTGAAGDFGRFGAPEVGIHVTYDEGFALALELAAENAGLNAGTLGEKDRALDHGTMVPLWFINPAYRHYKLVRIGLSGLPGEEHFRLGQLISQVADKMGRKVVFLASGDLSHRLTREGPYGFAEEGPLFDQAIIHAMEQGDFKKLLEFDEGLCDGAAQCGLGSILIMAGALEGKKVASRVLSYEGPFGVGYGVASFIPDLEG